MKRPCWAFHPLAAFPVMTKMTQQKQAVLIKIYSIRPYNIQPGITILLEKYKHQHLTTFMKKKVHFSPQSKLCLFLHKEGIEMCLFACCNRL